MKIVNLTLNNTERGNRNAIRYGQLTVSQLEVCIDICSQA